jgi:hypothetical protein
MEVYFLFDICLFIYLVPLALVGRLVKKIGSRQHRMGNNTQTTQNRRQKYKTNNKHKKNIKNVSRVIRK